MGYSRDAGQDQYEEGERRGDKKPIQRSACFALQSGNQRRHAHVFLPLKGDGRTKHGKPEERDWGQFVRPNQRHVEYVPSGDG